MFPVLVLLLGAGLSVPRMARANSGNAILETVGLGAAVGTVLGASTLSFYDRPADHLVNLAYGAGIGIVAGMGYLVFRSLTGEAQVSSVPGVKGSGDYNGIAMQRSTPSRKGKAESLNGDGDLGLGPRLSVLAQAEPRPFRSNPPAALWMPIVSLTW